MVAKTTNLWMMKNLKATDGPGEEVSTTSTAPFRMSVMANSSATFQSQNTGNNYAPAITTQQSAALDRVTILQAHPDPLPVLDPNKGITAPSLNPDQVAHKADARINDIKILTQAATTAQKQ